jgi:hypothetical protein
VNSGGEPERDDTGLPPVDIEIPDDARELDRDVQAYYRERRAERRRQRHYRLHRKISRDGIVLPLLACCLILALIAGTLLTVFTATSDQELGRGPAPSAGINRHTGSPAPGNSATGAPAASGPAPSSSSSRSSTASSPAALRPATTVVHTRKPLPSGVLQLTADGHTIRLRRLGQAMLVLVPADCRCGTAVAGLAGIAASQGVTTYLVGTPKTKAEVTRLHSGLAPSLRTATSVALDNQHVLAHYYSVRGLTAVLVSGLHQTVAYAKNLSASDDPAEVLEALAG